MTTFGGGAIGASIAFHLVEAGVRRPGTSGTRGRRSLDAHAGSDSSYFFPLDPCSMTPSATSRIDLRKSIAVF